MKRNTLVALAILMSAGMALAGANDSRPPNGNRPPNPPRPPAPEYTLKLMVVTDRSGSMLPQNTAALQAKIEAGLASLTVPWEASVVNHVGDLFTINDKLSISSAQPGAAKAVAATAIDPKIGHQIRNVVAEGFPSTGKTPESVWNEKESTSAASAFAQIAKYNAVNKTKFLAAEKYSKIAVLFISNEDLHDAGSTALATTVKEVYPNQQFSAFAAAVLTPECLYNQSHPDGDYSWTKIPAGNLYGEVGTAYQAYTASTGGTTVDFCSDYSPVFSAINAYVKAGDAVKK